MAEQIPEAWVGQEVIVYFGPGHRQTAYACATFGNSVLTNFGELRKGEVRRIPILGTSVNKGLLDCLLALPGRIGTQPQRDVCGLHSLPYHPHQVFAQGVQVCFVAQLGREGF